MNIPFLPKISPRSAEQRRADIQRQLIREEAKIGGELFGPVPNGHTRQFFCLDERTWVWHEEWLEHGQRRVVTTRYDMRPNAIVKSQDGQPHRLITKQEAQHLHSAIKLYKRKTDLHYEQKLKAA
jgi:hypothetical protein